MAEGSFPRPPFRFMDRSWMNCTLFWTTQTLKMVHRRSFATQEIIYKLTRHIPKKVPSQLLFKSWKYFSYINIITLRLICGNKMPTRCNRLFLLQILFLLNMFRAPLCPSSGAREYYTSGCCLSYLVLWFSSCRYGVELRVMCLVCGLLPNQSTKYDRQQPLVYYSRAPDDGYNGARNMLSKQ